MATANPVDQLRSLISLVRPTTTTQTESAGISQDSMNAMLQNILQSTQGLSAVASGQHAAGMYNSTVHTQLINDLMSRAASEVASKNSSRSVRTQQDPALGGTLGKLAQLYSLGKFAGNTDLGKKAVSKGSDLLSSLLSSSTTPGSLDVSSILGNTTSGADAGWNTAGDAFSAGADALSSLLADSSSKSGVDALAAMGSEDFGWNTAGDAFATEAATDAAAAETATAATPGVGEFYMLAKLGSELAPKAGDVAWNALEGVADTFSDIFGW